MKKTAILMTVLLAVFATSAKADLLGRWGFDGDALDSSGYGNHGTVYGGAAYVAAPMGQALSLDGYDDQVRVADDGSLEPANITVEAWVRKIGSLTGSGYIVSKYSTPWHGRSSYALYRGGSVLYFYIGTTAAQDYFVRSPNGGTALLDGEWHHVAGTYDGSAVRLYVDFAEIGSGTSTSVAMGYDVGDLYIGNYWTENSWNFHGYIDEVRIWDKALTTFPGVLAITVEIDIKPGTEWNPLNVGSNGVIPVAILTTEDFDAATVDPGTVLLAGVTVAVRGKSEKAMAHLEDVDGDGDIDLLVQIDTDAFAQAWTGGEVELTGETFDGQSIEGSDFVLVVPAE